MTPRELVTVILLGLACLFVLVAIILLLTRFTEKRLGTLAMMHSVFVNNPTYLVSAAAIVNEVYSSYKYGMPFNWTGILTILGISTAAVKMGQGQKAQQAIKEDTEVIVATMPIAPRAPRTPPPARVDDAPRPPFILPTPPSVPPSPFMTP